MVPVKAIDRQRMLNNFSGHARHYDRYASVQKRVVEHLCDICDNDVFSKGLVLDVGTGTGALAEAMTKRVQSSQLVVMDIAHGMTLEAVQRIADSTACDGDARSLPFLDESLSGVVSSSVYQWVENLPAAFAEIKRVLSPGGHFVLALFGERTLFELRQSHRHAVDDLSHGRPSHVQNFPAQSEVVNAITQTGLVCQSISSRMEIEFHEDVPDLLRQLKQIGASNAAADRPKGLASRAVMQRMIAIYEERYRSAEGVPASYEVILMVAQKKQTA